MKIINKILGVIKRHKRFLVTTHARCDGDALGSELSFAMMLRRMGKSVDIVNAGGIPEELMFLPGADKVRIYKRGNTIKPDYDVVVLLDSGGIDRLEEMETPVQELIKHGAFVVNIDHHRGNDMFGNINWVEPGTASVGEMIYQLVKTSGVTIDKAMATCLFVSIDTDTGHFVFSSTKPQSHYIAGDLLSKGINLAEIFNQLHQNKSLESTRLYVECLRHLRMELDGQVAWTMLTRQMYNKFRAGASDAQEYLTVLRAIKGVKIALLFKETLEDPLKIKLSVRARPPIDASKLMAHFNGGGHARAAGATLEPPITKAIQKVLKYIKEKNILH